MKKVVIYARYSSANQRQESITAQLRACRAYCENKKYIVVGEYTDEAQTATNDDRQAFRDMIRDAKRGLFSVVIFHKLDRSARNEYDYFNFKAQMQLAGVSLEYVEQHIDDTPEGGLMETLLVGMAAYYSRNLAREVIKGQRETALQGKHTGGIPPFGYDVGPDKKYIINENEAIAVRKIFEMRVAGKGYGDIINWLNIHGYKTKRGGMFGKNTILDMLKNRKYMGIFIYGRVSGGKMKKRNSHAPDAENIIEIPGAMPVIITSETWQAVQKKIKEDRKGTGSYTAKEVYLLSGIVKCSCGAIMTGARVKAKGKYYTYYQCANQHLKKNCDVPRIKKDYLEDYVLERMDRNLFSSDALPELMRRINKHMEKLLEIHAEEYKKLTATKDDALTKLKNILSLVESGEVDEVFKQRIIELRKTITLAEDKMKEIASGTDAYLSAEQIKDILDEGRKKEKTPEEIRHLFLTFIDSLVVSAESIDLTLRFCTRLVETRGIEPLTF